MGRVVHFEIHVEDIERAKTFYSNVFGWTYKHWGGSMEYWLIETGPDSTPGINGGMLPRREQLVAENITAFVCTIDVDSINQAIDAIIDNGGIIAIPTMTVIGMGWLAYAKDTEGNILGVIQRDESVS